MNIDLADSHLSAAQVHGDVESFPPHAELVRTLLSAGRLATLATISVGPAVEPGFPFASLVGYSVLDDASPLLLISELAEHTHNLRSDSRAGLLLTGLAVDRAADPLDRPRACLVGHARPYEPDAAACTAHITAHPEMADYLRLADFGWWRFEIAAARYVGGYGEMSWVPGSELARAQHDPVLLDAQAAIDHLNLDHQDSCLDLARWLVGIPTACSARVHAIDRRGVTLHVQVPDGPLLTVGRVAFPDGPLADASDLRPAVIDLVERARRRAAEAS